MKLGKAKKDDAEKKREETLEILAACAPRTAADAFGS